VILILISLITVWNLPVAIIESFWAVILGSDQRLRTGQIRGSDEQVK